MNADCWDLVAEFLRHQVASLLPLRAANRQLLGSVSRLYTPTATVADDGDGATDSAMSSSSSSQQQAALERSTTDTALMLLTFPEAPKWFGGLEPSSSIRSAVLAAAGAFGGSKRHALASEHVYDFSPFHRLESLDGLRFEGLVARRVDLSGVTRVRDIPNMAFQHCAIDVLQLPKSLTSISSFAFVQCRFRRLDGLSETDVRVLPESAFSHCAFDSIDLPPAFQFVGKTAFAGCVIKRLDLTNLLIRGFEPHLFFRAHVLEFSAPRALLEIAGSSFECFTCDGPLDFTPTDLRRVAPDAFNSANVSALILPRTLMVLEARALSRVRTPLLDLSALHVRVFDNQLLRLTKVDRILLPASLEAIGLECFAGFECDGHVDFSRTSLARLGPRCFHDAHFGSVTLPRSVTQLGTNCFLRMTADRLDLSALAASVLTLPVLRASGLRDAHVEHIAFPAGFAVLGDDWR